MTMRRIVLGSLLCIGVSALAPTSFALPSSPQVADTSEPPSPENVAPPTEMKAVSPRITELLKRLADQIETPRDAETVSAPPSEDAAPEEHLHYFRKRAQSAEILGRRKDAFDAYAKAWEFAEKAGDPRALSLLANQNGVAEIQFGDLRRGMGFFKVSLHYAEKSGRSPLILGRLALLAHMQAQVTGDLTAAEASLERVTERLAQMDQWPMQDHMMKANLWARSLHAKAIVLRFRGHPDEAESLHKDALDLWRPFKDETFPPHAGFEPRYATWLHAVNLSFYAETLARQGRLKEAEAQGLEAVEVALNLYGRNAPRTAITIANLLSSLHAQGRYRDVEVLAREVISIMEGLDISEDAMVHARARINLAKALSGQSRWKEAAEEYSRLEKATRDVPFIYKRFMEGNLDWGITLLMTGEREKGLGILDRVIEHRLRTVGPDHRDTALAQGMKAVALGLLGRRDEALEIYRQAIPTLTENARISSEAGSRSPIIRQLRIILEEYLRLLSNEKSNPKKAAADSFKIGDLIRGRTVSSALAASAARMALPNPDLARLAKEAQDSEKHVETLAELLADLLSRPKEQVPPERIHELRHMITVTREKGEKAFDRIVAEFPAYAQLVSPQPQSLSGAARSLRTGEAMIALLLGKRQSYVWAVTGDGRSAFKAIPVARDDVSEIVEDIRSTLSPDYMETLDDIPEFDLEQAYALYRDFLAPVEEVWSGARNLLVVSDGVLAAIPFSLLPTRQASYPPETDVPFANYRDVEWLARDHAVTVLPSASALASLRDGEGSRHTENQKDLVAFGDPVFSASQLEEQTDEGNGSITVRGAGLVRRNAPVSSAENGARITDLSRLPETRDELLSIADTLDSASNSDVYLGRAANERTVKQSKLDEYRVVAFATHGLLPGELEDLPQPALALSNPQVASVEGDGLLMMNEVMALDLNADWVVLSACNTGAGAGSEAEAMTGLGQAFFYAGTRALLVSNWPVESKSAQTLTTEVFRRQKADPTLGRAQALRQSMLSLIDGPGPLGEDGEPAYSYAHPIFWAPFSVVGDGGGYP